MRSVFSLLLLVPAVLPAQVVEGDFDFVSHVVTVTSRDCRAAPPRETPVLTADLEARAACPHQDIRLAIQLRDVPPSLRGRGTRDRVPIDVRPRVALYAVEWWRRTVHRDIRVAWGFGTGRGVLTSTPAPALPDGQFQLGGLSPRWTDLVSTAALGDPLLPPRSDGALGVQTSIGLSVEYTFASQKNQAAFEVTITTYYRPRAGAAPPSPPVQPPRTEPPKEPVGTRRFCDSDRDRWLETSERARLTHAHLETLRSAITQLDQGWYQTRDAAVAQGGIDVVMMATSLYFKSLAVSLPGQILESGVNAMIKEGLKKFATHCAGNGVEPEALMLALRDKGAQGAGKKVLDAFITQYLVEDVMDGTRPYMSVDQTARGNLDKFARDEFAAPTAKLYGVLLALCSTLESGYRSHVKMEALRIAIGYLRDAEIERMARWERLRQDLEVARFAYDHCLKLHPGERQESAAKRAEPPAPPPLRKAVEAAPVMGNLVQLALRGGEFVVESVRPGSIYEVAGLVPGAQLVAIDDQPVTGLTLEQVRARLKWAPGEPKLLYFELPGGKPPVHVQLFPE